MKNINIMKNIHSFIKSNCGIGGISSVSRRYLVLLITLLSLGVGNVWGNKGFNSSQAWNIQYYTSGNANNWLPVDGNDMGSTYNMGVMTNFYLKGCWVKTWSDNNWTTEKCRVYYWIDGGDSGSDYMLQYNSESNSNRTWTWDNDLNYNVIEKAGTTPGYHTLKLKWKLDEANDYQSSECGVQYIYPGFTTTSTSHTFANTTVGSTKDETISFGTHYGTALTTGNCAISGTNAGDFQVISINESGVTVRFKPTTAGNKSASLTITDAHSKTCTITLSGKTQYTVTYNKGTYGTGSDQTANKVYGTNLTLANSGYFTYTGHAQTAWNTNISGEGGTEYALNGTYSTEAAITLYPKWDWATYTITLAAGLGGSGSGSLTVTYNNSAINSGMTHNLTNTGYHLDGFYPSQESSLKVLNADGTFAASNVEGYISSGRWSHDGNCTLHAHWAANTYKITFDASTNSGTIINNGTSYEEGGARKITATYGSTVSGTMPTAQKNGYYFKGWYTEASGGSQVIDASGVWQNVGGYTNSSKEWKRAENTTLYAQYGTPTISATFSPASVLPLGTVTVTPSFDYAPEGSHILCYVLTTGGGDEMEVQPEFIRGDGYAVSFEAPATPGTYSVDIRLFNASDHSCADRETGLVSTYSHLNSFTVEASNAVTVQYKCGNVELRPSTTIYATSTQTSGAVTAPEIPGLVFSRWTTGANVSFAGGSTATDRTVSVNASAAGTLTAEYTQGPLFFKNTKNWDKVYVYFYKNTSYFTTNSSGSEGTGSNKDNTNFISGPYLMTLMEGTDEVYYYNGDIPANAATFAFTDKEMNNYNYFAGSTTTPCEVVRVTSVNANKPMIVPVGNGALWNQKKARYYGHDEAPILMDWGYNLRGVFNNWSSTKNEFTSTRLGDLSFTTTAYLDAANATYQWKVYNGNLGYGLSGTPTLTQASPTSSNLASYDANGYNLQVQSNIAGEYTFTLNYGLGTGTGNTNGASVESALTSNMKVTVTYPVVAGDFRLVYTGGANPHPGNVVKKRADGVDIVDMYVAAGQSDALKVQSCTAVSASSVTWGSLSAPTYAEGVDFSSILSAGGTGVYSFTIEQNENGTAYKITKVEKYTGRFYVRTNCVNDDKWNYKDSKDAHAMTYSEYSTTLTKKPFSHYYVKDIHGTSGSSVNIRFTVATENSEAITDTVFGGETEGDYKDNWGNESLTTTANVRFTYNQATNKIWRAYTIGPENDNYMVLRSGSGVYKYNNGTKGAASTAIKFNDMNNWVYQVDVFADAGTYVKLTALFNSVTQYIKGIESAGTDGTEWNADDAELLLSSSKATTEHMRVTYDFKTDRMIIAWLPSNTITTNIDLDADVLLIRRHQEAGQSITISGANKLQSVKTVYGVMQFDKDYLNDVTKSRYSRDLYWISFPFEVKLSDVFGFGTYGQHWIIEYYDGKARAQKGYWADSPGFWEFVTPDMRDTYVLEANKGYVLALDLDELGDGDNGSTLSNVWNNSVTSIYLYFPSSTTIGDLENVSSVTVDVDQEGYQCTINRHTQAEKDAHTDTDINKNRTVADSYWHMIGAPSYANAGRTSDLGNAMPETTITDNLLYVYEWNPTTNLYNVHSTSSMTFDAMRSYMVQYNGANITWTNVTAHPSGIVARRRQKAEDTRFAEFSLDMARNGESLDHTYVRLTDKEEATANFDFNLDLAKEFNGNHANIYTIIEGYMPAAGNSLPLSATETTLVPVGVQISEAGEYTFAIPDGTSGVGVTLIDNETGSRTSLSALDYTVNLTAGEYTSRFVLEISPVQNTPTGIGNEEIVNRISSHRKLLIDGILYIVRDGKMYDACGVRVK